MPNASFNISNFLGGELSQFAQGRFDKPDYRTSMNVCLNSFPVEIGAWTRRPGTHHAGHTRAGAPGRVIKFDFEQSSPVTLEFTDGFLRFRNGAALIITNDTQSVIGISGATPAIIQTNAPVNWATGDTLIFGNMGATVPLLQQRQFRSTKIDTTHFSIQDALTGANIDGTTISGFGGATTVSRVQELATVYSAGQWASVRPVQAETTDILLTPTLRPQALTVPTLPAAGINPVFAVAPATFNDGPYLDPFINGVQATPGATTGVISLTLSFPAFSATKAYAIGAFVTSGGVNYISLVDQNVGNTPVSSPSQWAPTTASAAINNGNGFLGTDIGRLVRLFSEPAAWATGSTYAVGNVVSYNPSGIPGASTYWQSLTAGNTGFAPGSDLTHWQLVPQGAAGSASWTWGKIVSLSTIIDRALASSTSIGNMTLGGGLNSVFDGVFAKAAASSAARNVAGGFVPAGTVISLTCFVGKNYSVAGAQKIAQVTIYPPSDLGFAFGNWTTPTLFNFVTTTRFNLWGKSSAPGSAEDGTLLGSSALLPNGTTAITIVSSDQVTAWNYVWVEMITIATVGGSAPAQTTVLENAIGQLSFFGPAGTGTGAGVNVEILGAPMLYTNPILTWRLGVYSDTTGYPTCGTYNDGRLFLGGAVGNRFDACVSNGILGSTVNFAPTDQYGVVSPSSAISYTFNSDGVNQILWMKSDLQGVLMGTQSGEWLVQAPTAGSITPTNISARNVTNHGSDNIQPCRTEHTNLFVQRFGQKLLEYFPDVFSGKFSAPNLADKAQHITHSHMAELAYVSAVTPIVWGRDALGALFGITYKRDSLASSQPPTFYGWHHHALGSGRIVESICTGPSTGGDLDTLTMVTNDIATNIRHVEVMTDAGDELSTLSSAWYLDDALNPTSTVSSGSGLTINGLWPLNGKTVQVYASGLDCGDPGEGKPFLDFVVSNGSVFVPYGDGISAGAGRGLFTAAFAATATILVGFTYNSDGQMARPILVADTGARIGPALGEIRRIHRYSMLLNNALGISVGTSFSKMRPVPLTQQNGNAIPPLTIFSGVAQNSLEDDFGYDGMICWRVSRPWPATVVALGGNISTQDQ